MRMRGGGSCGGCGEGVACLLDRDPSLAIAVDELDVLASLDRDFVGLHRAVFVLNGGGKTTDQIRQQSGSTRYTTQHNVNPNRAHLSLIKVQQVIDSVMRRAGFTMRAMRPVFCCRNRLATMPDEQVCRVDEL